MEINPAQRAGKILRMLREEAGKTQVELAKEAFSSASMISYLESGTKAAKSDLIARIGEALGHKDLVTEVRGFTMSGGYSTELHAAQEADAVRIHHWEPRMIPGLLQTPAYATALFRSGLPREADVKIDELVAARIERQGILTLENPPIAWFVIDEAVLYRPYGGNEVMREQMRKLAATAGQPRVNVQVMLFTATRHPGFEGPLRILEFRDNPPIWYTERWSSGRMTEDKDEVVAAMSDFDHIRASALSPEQSIDFINSVRDLRYE